MCLSEHVCACVRVCVVLVYRRLNCQWRCPDRSNCGQAAQHRPALTSRHSVKIESVDGFMKGSLFLTGKLQVEFGTV